MQGEVGGGGVNLAMSGNIDFSSGEPRLSGGMVGTPMKGHLAKRIWPMFVASKVRNWVFENIQGGDVDPRRDRGQCADADAEGRRPADPR